MRFMLAIILSITFAVPSYASRVNEKELSAAESIVSSYKELRKYCSVARGQERKDCFRDLNSANEEYQEAKSVLARHYDKGDEQNLHMVSYVN